MMDFGRAGMKKIIFVILCLLLTATSFGCLGTETYTIEGKIMTENGSQPFDNAKIYIELVNMTDSKNIEIMERITLENGSEVNYTYTMIHDNILDPKGIYVVSAYVDKDDSKTVSDGDYTSKPLFRLEPNMIEQPFDIYVYPYKEIKL